MTRDELQQRMVLIEGKKREDRAAPLRTRKRDPNYVEPPEKHPSEHFDDFFDYEREMNELTPARDTVGNDIDSFTKNDPEPKKVEEPGFIIMEKMPEEPLKANNIVIVNEESISEENDESLPFEFYRCTFVKDDGDQCKKQAKKGNDYCGIHKRYVEKNNL